MKYNFKSRPSGLFLFLAVFLLASVCAAWPAFGSGREAGLLKVTFLDIGQGDCQIIRTPSGKVIMIDAGDDRVNAADGIIIPYLNANGIKKIDIFIMTHAHRDHIGGLVRLVQKVPIGAVYENRASTTQMYVELMKSLKAKGIPVYKAWQGDKLDLGDGIDATVLHPSREWYGVYRDIAAARPKAPSADGDSKPVGTASAPDTSGTEENLNNFSVVLRLQYGSAVYNFSGDAEKEAEDYIMSVNPAASLKCDVYKVAHHGSLTSSTPTYLSKLKPAASILSCGVGNPFHHPATNTVKNLEHYSKVVYRTDTDRTVETWSDGAGINYSCDNSANQIVTGPKVTNITPYSATIEWETSQLSSTKVIYNGGDSTIQCEKSLFDYSLGHRITLAGLKPGVQYKFEIQSVGKKESANVLTNNGAFQTLSTDYHGDAIESVGTNPAHPLINEPVTVGTLLRAPQEGCELSLYEDCIHENALVKTVKAGSERLVQISWTPARSKTFELFAVLSSGGKVMAVSALTIECGRRLVVIDEGHANSGRGGFEDMKLDLFNRGLETSINSGRFSSATFAGASVLILSEPATGETELTASEIAELKKFLDSGGSLLLVGRCDYKGLSSPAGLNRVLEQIGSSIRVNDDEVLDRSHCMGTMPWAVLGHIFDEKVISAGVDTVINQNTASLLNSKMKPITSADQTIIALCVGDDDSTNVDADGAKDGVIYPAGVPIVMDAAELLPSGGKVAVFGSLHMMSNVYAFSSTHQTPLYNFEVVNWLSHPEKRGVAELSAEIKGLSRSARTRSNGAATVSAAIGASIRAQELRAKIIDEFDFSSSNIESTLDSFITYLDRQDRSGIAELSHEIKMVLDRVRYSVVENPDAIDKLGKKITMLEDLYRRSINAGRR